jgi:hypothetical protein
MAHEPKARNPSKSLNVYNQDGFKKAPTRGGDGLVPGSYG